MENTPPADTASPLHLDAAAIERIGDKVVMEHFAVTRQALGYWKKNGVPKQYRRAVKLLAAAHNLSVPEMDKPRDHLVAA